MDVAASAPELRFEVLGAAHVPHAAQPTLRLELGATEGSGREVYAVTLTAQVMLDPAKREYDDATRADLVELFGVPERWPATTHSFLWCHVSTVLHTFTGATTFGLELPCTADLEQPAARYAAALPDGEIPITLHFSGRVLYAGDGGQVWVAHISWETEAPYRLPTPTFQAMIDHHHGDQRFVRVHRDTLDELARRKSDRGLMSYDALMLDLLAGEEAHVHDH